MGGTMSHERASFSQFGEDLVVLAVLQMYGRSENGFYVDVGALNPWFCSNTALLHRDHGWHGLNIDASEGAVDEFMKERPGDVNLQVLVGLEERDVNYYVFDHPGVNTADPVMQLQQTGERSPFKHLRTDVLRTRPLRAVLNDSLPPNTEIGFMSVDVEGMDLEVLQSNDWERFRPFVLAVETHGMDCSRPANNPTNQFLEGIDYRLVSHVFATSIYLDMQRSQRAA